MSGVRFRVGTSGWHYADWSGRFYPPDLPKHAWLRFYAGEFDTVELNRSFYRLPDDATWDVWRAATPRGFRFAVKASRYITHLKRLRGCEDAVGRLFQGALRLEERLGPILYQLPPSFRADPERLDAFCATLPRRRRHVFEFRDPRWFTDEVFRVLRRRRAGFCCFHMPELETPWLATARFAYVRLHGAGERYAGRYPPATLRRFARRIRALAADCSEVWIYFNNDHRAHAVANARSLRELLG